MRPVDKTSGSVNIHLNLIIYLFADAVHLRYIVQLERRVLIMPTLKSTNLNLRIAPDVREALKQAAERELRSVSNMVEYLIVQHCQTNEIPIKKQKIDSKQA